MVSGFIRNNVAAMVLGGVCPRPQSAKVKESVNAHDLLQLRVDIRMCTHTERVIKFPRVV